MNIPTGLFIMMVLVIDQAYSQNSTISDASDRHHTLVHLPGIIYTRQQGTWSTDDGLFGNYAGQNAVWLFEKVKCDNTYQISMSQDNGDDHNETNQKSLKCQKLKLTLYDRFVNDNVTMLSLEMQNVLAVNSFDIVTSEGRGKLTIDYIENLAKTSNLSCIVDYSVQINQTTVLTWDQILDRISRQAWVGIMFNIRLSFASLDAKQCNFNLHLQKSPADMQSTVDDYFSSYVGLNLMISCTVLIIKVCLFGTMDSGGVNFKRVSSYTCAAHIGISLSCLYWYYYICQYFYITELAGTVFFIFVIFMAEGIFYGMLFTAEVERMITHVDNDNGNDNTWMKRALARVWFGTSRVLFFSFMFFGIVKWPYFVYMLLPTFSATPEIVRIVSMKPKRVVVTFIHVSICYFRSFIPIFFGNINTIPNPDALYSYSHTILYLIGILSVVGVAILIVWTFGFIPRKRKRRDIPLLQESRSHRLIPMAPPPNAYSYESVELGVLEEDLTCAICLENIQKGKLLVSWRPLHIPGRRGSFATRTYCEHTFHTQCVNKWYKTSLSTSTPATCPTCRYKLRPYQEPSSYYLNRLFGSENS
jgi:hypothetical protein